MQQRRGFATFELLWVIALFSVGLGISMPVLGNLQKHHHPSALFWLSLPALLALLVSQRRRFPEELRDVASLFLCLFGLPGGICFLRGIQLLMKNLLL